MSLPDAIFYASLVFGFGLLCVGLGLAYIGRCMVKSKQVNNIYTANSGPKSANEMTPGERADFEKQKAQIVKEARERLRRRQEAQAQGGSVPTASNTRPARYVVDRTRG